MKGKWIFGIGIAIVAIAAVGLAFAGVVAARTPKAPAPNEVVTHFYNWYLGYPGNPLVDGAYRTNEHLTEDFIARVDETLASFDKGGYDPFLLAQDIPQSVTVGEANVDGTVAYVQVETSFEGHGMMVTLKHVNDAWKIDDVSLPADAIVESFYNWYLWYARGGEEMRNPLVDGAYADSGYLTADFIARIEQDLAAMDKGGADPILLAQDVPERVDVVETSVSGIQASVKVHLFWSGNPTPSQRTVSLVLMDGGWKIDGITH